MKTFKNTRFTKRDYECTNIVACRSEKSPTTSDWKPADDSVLFGLTMLYRQAGVEYWGYL